MGDLIVFEGIDKVGKSTQVKMLADYYCREGRKCKVIKFPSKEGFLGQIIQQYLNGEWEYQINPYTISSLYAQDRFEKQNLISDWLQSGYIVICDRYYMSNLAHQGAKFDSEKEYAKFKSWLLGLELEWNQIFTPLVSICFDVPLSFINSCEGDIHESDQKLQKRALEIYKSEDSLEFVEVWKEDHFRDKQDIHQEVVSILEGFKI